MKGKTKTILTIIIAILVFAIAVVGTVTFLKDDGEASATEGTTNTLPVTGMNDEQTNSDAEENLSENLDEEENLEEQIDNDENENSETAEEETTGGNTQETTETEEQENIGTTGGQTEPEPTIIEQERLVSTTLNWSNISLNSTIGNTGINYTNLGYIIKYYQIVSEEKTIELKTETGKEEYGTTVIVTEEQIAENCPTGYKFSEENSTLSTIITENVNGNIIEVYYIRDSFNLKIEYKYEDGTPASDPYKESVEFEGEYSVESPEIPGYTPNIDVVEGTMPGEDKTITVVYTPNTDVSYSVKYLEQGTEKELASEKLVENKTFDETYTETAKDITGYTVVGEATQTITLDAYNKELTFYYTANTDVSYTVRYLEEGTGKVLAQKETRTGKTFNETYKEEAKTITGYKVDASEKEIKLDAYNKELVFYYTANEDVSYTVKYLELETEKELAHKETRTGKTFNETYKEEAKTITGYKVDASEKEIKLDAYNKELVFYYTKNNYNYIVKYFYEGPDGEYYEDDTYVPTKISAKFEDVITTFEPRTLDDNYVLNHVTPADENGNPRLVISADESKNIIEVYYERNTFEYKVEYYINAVSQDNFLGATESKEQKLETQMSETIVTADFGADWINAKKPQVGYQDGVVVEYITIQANNDNVIQVVYYPRADIPYSVEYYFNGVKDTTGKNYSYITTYGTKITQVNDYSNDGEWTLDEKNSTKLPFEVLAVSGNIIRIYYVKPEIRVEKTSVVNTTRTTGAENTVEPGETITYTIKATNSGSIEGKVTIGDSIPDGTTLAEGTVITATGFDTVSKEQLEKGIELTVPANGEATVQFTVTVTENAGKDVINIPDVNGEEDEANTVTNPIEKTIEVKAKTQTIANSNIVIVLDTSISMDDPSTEASNTVCRSHWRDSSHRRAGCIEVDGTWYKPKTRMDVAKEVVNNFIDNMKLPETKTVNSCAVTVIEFNGSARVVGTADTQGTATILKNSVTSLEMDYYTNMTSALKLAETELKDLASARPDNTNIVIFVSDGEPTVEKNGISSAANSLKNVKLNSGKALNPTVYTVAFGSDIAILRDTIATDPTKYYTTETSGSLGNIFSSLQDNMADFKPMQSSDGLITLPGVYADETHPIKITVNGSAIQNITALPTDKSGYVILDNGNYYLDLTKFNATDSITIEYYSNN